MVSSYKGSFQPKNPQKYKGDPTKIVYRSMLELKVMLHFDKHPDVLEWSSEEIIIPYRSPIDNRIHRYFPDFYVKKRNRDGTLESCIIEVKPKSQTRPPSIQKKATRRYINEVQTWGVNSAKWEAAKIYCDDRKYNFITMTEEDIG